MHYMQSRHQCVMFLRIMYRADKKVRPCIFDWNFIHLPSEKHVAMHMIAMIYATYNNDTKLF